ncbi:MULTISPECIES: hypothetical protein [Microbacterium]|uniref:hypothetical protein n=1 Tax=Microbacterium TaxID=33882 RepID=UPI000CFC4E67|nr:MULTISPECIES: hypothetical protein [unclassified Microbacterium]PRB10912.1 hypothetical protein CQ047_05415 [Microbacterium sp. MYb72]
MRYLFSTGLFAAISAGISLLRGTREAPITWRAVLAWVSWGITLALAIGAVIDTRRDERGDIVAPDSPLASTQAKRAKKAEKAAAKALKR